MNNIFTVDEFIRFAFDDLRLSEKAYLEPKTTDLHEMAPGKITISKILNYSKVLEVIRFGEKNNFSLIIN